MSWIHLKSLRKTYGERPVPLWYWSRWQKLLRIFSSDPDPLFPPGESFQSTGASLTIEALRKLLINETLGEWALDAETIRLLWSCLHREQPQLVVECGSGISTLVFAQYAALSFSAGDPRWVVSIEQNSKTARSVLDRLNQAGLEHVAFVVHSPLDAQGNYSLDNFEKIVAQLPRKIIDCLIIDGPAGKADCRLQTLPKLLPHCREGARWFLDDAFRDGEMAILNQWSRLDNIQVEGIYPIGKGLGVGLIGHPS